MTFHNLSRLLLVVLKAEVMHDWATFFLILALENRAGHVFLAHDQ